MLGRRGEFEGVTDWLPVLPLWSAPSTVRVSKRILSLSSYRILWCQRVLFHGQNDINVRQSV